MKVRPYELEGYPILSTRQAKCKQPGHGGWRASSAQACRCMACFVLPSISPVLGRRKHVRPFRSEQQASARSWCTLRSRNKRLRKRANPLYPHGKQISTRRRPVNSAPACVGACHTTPQREAALGRDSSGSKERHTMSQQETTLKLPVTSPGTTSRNGTRCPTRPLPFAYRPSALYPPSSTITANVRGAALAQAAPDAQHGRGKHQRRRNECRHHPS